MAGLPSKSRQAYCPRLLRSISAPHPLHHLLSVMRRQQLNSYCLQSLELTSRLNTDYNTWFYVCTTSLLL